MTRLSEIEARAAKATPGPWRPQGGFIYIGGSEPTTLCSYVVRDEDADFIAHAREDIPYLLGRLREAQEALIEARPYVFGQTHAKDWRGETAQEILARVDEALAALEKP